VSNGNHNQVYFDVRRIEAYARGAEWHFKLDRVGRLLVVFHWQNQIGQDVVDASRFRATEAVHHNLSEAVKQEAV